MKMKIPLILACLITLLACNEKNNVGVPKKEASVMAIKHPLDALNQDELKATVDILKAAGKYTDKTRVPEISLREPSKEVVYAWKVGNQIPRKANVIILDDKKTYEAVVDIVQKKLESFTLVEGVQPALLLEEWQKAGELWKEDPRVVEELKKRGYTNLKDIAGAPLTAGYFGKNETRDKRLLKVWLLDIKDCKYNLFAKPINGITPVIDLFQNKVVDVLINTYDEGKNEVIHDYDAASTKAKKMKPVLLSSPEGNNYTFKDGKIQWNKWQFHLRLDKRFGAVISLAEFDGQSVAYQMSANEMFVPYMDPAQDWKYRSYMDIGEYGFGLLSSKLELGTDVPQNATLQSAVIPSDNGTPVLYENVIGIFERNTGRPSWRHAELLNGSHESRAEVELVVRTIPVVGNYDYIVDYVFSAKGLINIEVGATGMDAVKTTKAKTMQDPTAQIDTKVGGLVAPNLIAVHHDHFLAFRLDMDVDGVQNSIMSDEIVPVTYPKNERLSGWEVVEHPVLTESLIAEKPNGHDAFLRVMNVNKKNTLGQNKGFTLTGHTHLSKLNDADYPAKRAKWSKHAFWVTPYKPDELYPSSKYPNQSEGNNDIGAWMANKESVVNTDVVCWYTMGFHHVTLPEDWPILPTVWHSLTIRPARSYNRNPAVDLAK